MNSIVIKLKENIKNPKFLVIVGILGIMLIFLSSLNTSKAKSTHTDTKEISVEKYQAELEKDIKQIVKSITGSSRATVVVTLESGMRYKYADITEGACDNQTESNRTSTSSEQKQGYITVKNSQGGEEALLVTTQMPEIRGVAIVCLGGDNQIVAEKIENAVTAALNITSQRVDIAGGT